MFSIMKNRELRTAAALHCEDNIYELKRTRILRVVREYDGSLELAAERLGCSDLPPGVHHSSSETFGRRCVIRDGCSGDSLPPSGTCGAL